MRNPEKVRVLLVDDHLLVRQGLRKVLEGDPRIEVVGVARTLLGVQVSREVPWPPELTPQMVKRLEIRAAVLAASVHTADGVELTVRQSEP